MTLEQKAEEYIEKNCKIWEEGELTVDEIVRLAYLAGAEEVKSDCDFALEGKDVEIKELKEENNRLLDVINNQDVKIADLEKMLAEQYPDLKQSLDWANERENENVVRLEKANTLITEIKNWYLNTDICSEPMPKELILKIDEWLKE